MLRTISIAITSLFFVVAPALRADAPQADEREKFEASGFVGASIDSFAAKPVQQVLGYKSSDTGPKTGFVAGINFAYRLTPKDSKNLPVQLWVYGETVHGQRSAEIQCDKTIPDTDRSPLCKELSALNARDQFFAVLRNASSLEGFFGLRLEFLQLREDKNSAALYFKSQLGLITMQENGGDAIDDHIKFAFGAIMTSGVFQGSYLETGLGRTDLFKEHRGRRFKVDGYVQWRIIESQKWIAPFFQLSVNSDFGPGADDIRTYYGINFDLRELGCKFKKCD
jgi:hypothetical protein